MAQPATEPTTPKSVASQGAQPADSSFSYFDHYDRDDYKQVRPGTHHASADEPLPRLIPGDLQASLPDAPHDDRIQYAPRPEADLAPIVLSLPTSLGTPDYAAELGSNPAAANADVTDIMEARAEVSRLLARLPDRPLLQPSGPSAIVPSANSHRIASWYEPDHFVIPFRNGSQSVTPDARDQAAAIASSLSPGDRIELRGRVGNTSISDDDARLATGRAIAIRKELMALGITKDRIKIRFPRSADILDTTAFDSPLNMSVSVFVMPAEGSEPALASSVPPGLRSPNRS